MAFAELDPKTQALAERVLTKKQLDVFKLWCNGAGTARIAMMLDISEPVARRALSRSQQLIRIEIERVE